MTTGADDIDFNSLNEPTGEYNRKDFMDLNCWQKARELRNSISKLTRSFPDEEKYRLTDQIIRASRSVMNNIAEGFGRYHFKESIKFCFVSRGSLFEVKDHLLIALDEEYIDESTFESFEAMRNESTRILNGYIRYLIKLAKEQRSNDYMR